MLKRIYIDNFRGLVNFELNLDSINLFLGGNGAGKSTVFDVLYRLQCFVLGFGKVEQFFSQLNCTRWQNLPIQRFEIEVLGNGGIYKYELVIEHNQEQSYIQLEQLFFDNQNIFIFERGELQAFDDNYVIVQKYPFDWFQSTLPFFVPRKYNTKVIWFRERMERLIIVRIDPTRILAISEQEQKILNPFMDNFFSWYRYISEDQSKVAELTPVLKGVLDGFIGFRFEKIHDKSLIIKLKFSDDKNRNIEYSLSELSDGQKTIIALYTLLYCTQSEDYTLCIDEPENYLALPEIQPWLIQLYDFCIDRKLQALLISHHPVLINYLLASPIGYWFERQNNTPVRVKSIGNEEAKETGLPISELIARGWLYDPE